MSDISIIIDTFSEENKREFLSFIQKKNRRGDTKNSALFKLIDSGKTKDIDIQLYGKPSRNAYHALCKRLQDSLIDFIASKGFAGETSEEMDILKLLLASRIFFEHRKYKIGFKTLSKAERTALNLDVYSILNEIYHTKIQYAHLNSKLLLSEVIAASQENMKHFQQEQQLNMAYAYIKAQMHRNSEKSINDIISDAFENFQIELDKTLTYKSLFQLMNITATAARLQSDFYPISPFMMKIYGIISEKQKIVDKHLFYHIEILHLMAHTSFRLKNFEASMEFLKKMEIEMLKKNRAYYNRFREKLIVIKALNQNYTGLPNDAIATLQNYSGESLDIDLTLVMSLFQQSEFKQAYQLIKSMHHSDTWYEKKAGWIWVLKKNIIEILLLIELDKLDLVLSRVQSFKARFTRPLKTLNEERVLTFVQLAAYYYEYPEKVNTQAFKEKVEASFNWKEAGKEDVFVMSFYAWLKAKMEKKE
ncbi:MAG: hypothetical protein JKY22_02350, partial [Flavobacteriaceae bacterium]|nr:hypothetical protein [Flavobacteriaceae bacterium]